MSHQLASALWRTALTGLALASVAVPGAAQGADRAEEVRLRNDCRLAAQVVETGQPRTRTAWARGFIGACADEGPPALVALWNSAQSDTADTWFLITSSAELRDDRLYRQLREVAVDRSRGDMVRVAAMLVLVRYARPSNAFWFTDVAPPAGPVERIPLRGPLTTGAVYRSGAVPLPSPVAPDILQLLSEIGDAREDSRSVWFAAAVLAKRIRYDVEAEAAH